MKKVMIIGMNKKSVQSSHLCISETHDIVKANGGALKVETMPARAGTNMEGEGTIFTIHLPG